jgi:uncharacterized protein GlcG (DUF336 family)
MTKRARLFRVGLVVLFVAVSVLVTVDAWAQGDVKLPLEKAVMTGDMAKRALTKYQISADIAEKIVNACVDLAKANNGTVSVFVLAPDGQIVHSHRMDGQNTVNTETAYKKAQTALKTRTSTHASVNGFRTLDSKLIRLSLDLYLVSGGLPIIVDDQLIGSIGVGGANGVPGGDEACGHQALTKVLGPQPPLAPNMPADPLGTNAPAGGGGRGGAGGGAGAGGAGGAGRGGQAQ